MQRFLQKLAYFSPGGFSVRPKLHSLRGVEIGKNVWISQFVYIDEIHPKGVVIGDNCTIGLRTSIFSHFYWGSRKSKNYKRVIIEKNVFIGPHCLILPGVKIGEGSVIKGGTVVSKNVPPFTLWGLPDSGPLAKVTVPLINEFSYEKFLMGLRPINNRSKIKE
jgi:acetyltransferase-like isoleucine patch superfamily enzyme